MTSTGIIFEKKRHIYLYGRVSLLARVFCVFVCVFAKEHIFSDLSTLDALLHKAHSKVLLVIRYQGSTNGGGGGGWRRQGMG